MRKLAGNHLPMTLDGVMPAPGGPSEDDDAWPLGGWSLTYWDDRPTRVAQPDH
jgi:hypothetical protein